MQTRRRSRSWLTLTAATLALSLGATACGGSEDGAGGGGGGDTAGLELDGDGERRVSAAVAGLYDDLADYDAEAVCARMTPRARRQIARGAIGTRAADADATCSDTFGRFLDQTRRAGGFERTLEAEVVGVEVDGGRAVATVAFGPQRGEIPLRRIRGEWKLGISVAAPSSAPPGNPPKLKRPDG